MKALNLFVGCDVSKGHSDFVVLDEQRKLLSKSFKLSDNVSGHEKIKKKLQIFLETSDVVQIHFGVESTGGYENHWCNLLRAYSERVFVYRINPRAVKAFSVGQMTRSGSDKISASSIANYMISHPQKMSDFKLNRVRNEEIYRGKKNLRFISSLTKTETHMRNAFEKLLFDYYPSLLAHSKGKIPNYLLRILTQYPDARKALKASKSALFKVKGLTAERQVKLKKALKLLPTDKDIDFDLVQISAQLILQQQSLVNAQKKKLIRNYKHLPGVELLASIPGVGLDSATALILEIGSIQRFSSAKKLVAFFGMSPCMKESGDGKTRTRLSKCGNSSVRSRLFMCVFTMISGKGIFKKRNQKLLAKGRHYLDVRCILMHKLLRIVFGILKSGKPFDLSIDKANRKKAKAARKKHKESKLESEKIEAQKLQNETFFDAPISARMERNLKKQTDVPIE